MRYFLAFLLTFLNVYAGSRIYGNIILLPENLYAILVSKSSQEAIVVKMENGIPATVEKFTASTGFRFGDKIRQGDYRTPEGVYFPVSFKPDNILPAYYGAGAYPLNYPNALDRYVLKRDGDGIWIHASDKREVLYFSSKGCVILNNLDFSKLRQYIKLKKTPVIIQEYPIKTDIKFFIGLKQKVDSFINKYRNALFSVYAGNTDNLSLLYSDLYHSKTGIKYDILKFWKKELYSISNNKPFVHILNKMAFYDVRKDKKFIVIVFDLVYLSGDETEVVKKVLYLDKNLKIITEENLGD